MSEDSTFYTTACKGNLKQKFMEITLFEAHGVKQNELLEEEKKDSIDMCNDVLAANNDFHAYCVISARLSIARWPNEISQNDMLCTLAIDLLDPFKPNFQLLSTPAYRQLYREVFQIRTPLEHSIPGFGMGYPTQ